MPTEELIGKKETFIEFPKKEISADISQGDIGLRREFDRLEKSIEKASNFMMSLTGIITSVFFVTGILIAFDYFKNNEERYEKFIY